MEKVIGLIQEIKEKKTQTSASQKDELRVMRAMLNDREYTVGVYGKEGLEGTICPAQEARDMVASVLTSTAKIPAAEAEKLANEHEFKKAEAANFINISKEFVNTYLETGRKLPLGGREQSNVSLCLKEVQETERTYPNKVGVNEDGTARYENGTVTVKAHKSVRVIGPCPDWVK